MSHNQNLKTGYFIGTINEEGWLDNYTRKGFNALSSWDELIANSLDADASRVQFDRDPSYIHMSDDGKGMDRDTATVMFNMYQKIKRTGKIGMANAGSKYALYTLGNQKMTCLITLKDGEYLTIIANWAKMLQEGRYSSNIYLRESIPEEIERFQTLMPRTSGTTVCLTYSPEAWTAIEEQINHGSEGGYIDIGKSLAFRYGRYPREISIYLFEKGQRFQMKQFNPSLHTLFDKYVRRIDVFHNGQRFQFVSDQNETFKKAGKGIARENTKLQRAEMEQLGKHIGSMDVICYIPYDPDYMTSYLNAKGWIPPHFREIYNHSPKEIQIASMYPGVFRHGYRLGSMDLNASTENIRSSYESRLYYDIQTDVVIHESENDCLDQIMGTQENKGQYIDTSPTEAKRLVDFFKREYKTIVLEKIKQIGYEKKKSVEVARETREPTREPSLELSLTPLVPLGSAQEPEKDVKPKKRTVVAQHVKGILYDTDYDIARDYLVQNKDEMLRHTAFITFVNTFKKEKPELFS
jgi:hypothetical protein